MEQLTKRQQARDEVFKMLFEHEFNPEKTAEEIYDDALAARAFREDPYIKKTLLGVFEHMEELNLEIERHSVGWKRNRISPASIAVMELCLYEMKYCLDIPLRVSLNEAVELAKRYDEEKARGFVNGILNAAMRELAPTRENEEKPQKADGEEK